MAERAVSGRGTPRRYVLSGLLRCGKCGGKLFPRARAAADTSACEDLITAAAGG